MPRQRAQAAKEERNRGALSAMSPFCLKGDAVWCASVHLRPFVPGQDALMCAPARGRNPCLDLVILVPFDSAQGRRLQAPEPIKKQGLGSRD
jgi:hypothetical protein